MSTAGWILDKLKLVGGAILLIGVLVAIRIYNPFSHDDDVVDMAGKLAIELCECELTQCADRVMAKVEEEIIGQEVSGGIGSAHTKARDQLIYLNKCHKLISEGASYTFDKRDGKVFGVYESVMNDMEIDLGL